MNADTGSREPDPPPKGEGTPPAPDRTIVDPLSRTRSTADDSAASSSSSLDRTLASGSAGDRTLVVGPGATSSLPKIPDVTLTGELGRGGMGVVYRGRQVYLDRVVAVKLLDTNFRGSDFEKRFRREARILAGLTHPNIVACYQAGVTEEGNCYIVMEFVDASSLRAWIDQNGCVPLARALALCRDMARALSHAHDAGIIHRDVKPENVLLQRDERAPASDPFPFRAKLADLGLARSTTSVAAEMNLTVQGAVMGTVATMAPEQFDDPDHVDFRADVYGLGCVLFHAVTGRVAYPQRTISNAIASKMQPTPPDPRQIKPDVPAGVVNLLAKMLSREREERLPSYAALIARCDELIAESGEAPPAAAGKKRRVRLGVAIGAVALAAVGVLWFAVSKPANHVDPTPSPEPQPDPHRVDPVPNSTPNPEPQRVDPTPNPAPKPVSRKALVVSILGPTQVQEGEGVKLSVSVKGSGSGALDIEWKQTGGPAVETPKEQSMQLGFTAPASETDYDLAFQVVVTEKGDRERTGEPAVTTVHVKSRPAPKLEISGPARVEAGSSSKLQGKRPESGAGELRRFEWKLRDGDPGKLERADTSSPTYIADEHDGDYDVLVTARGFDGRKWSSYVTHEIHVEAPTASRPIPPDGSVPLWTTSAWGPPSGKCVFSAHDEQKQTLILDSPTGAGVPVQLRRGTWRLRGSLMLSKPFSSEQKNPQCELRLRCGSGSGVALKIAAANSVVRCELFEVTLDPKAADWSAKPNPMSKWSLDWNYDQELPIDVTWNGNKLSFVFGAASSESPVVGPFATRPTELWLWAKGGVANITNFEVRAR